MTTNTPAPSLELVNMLALMTGLVKLKYGNLEPDIWHEIQKSERLIADCQQESNKVQELEKRLIREVNQAAGCTVYEADGSNLYKPDPETQRKMDRQNWTNDPRNMEDPYR